MSADDTEALARMWGVAAPQTVVEGRSDGVLMTAEEFREWLVQWGLNIDDFAFLTGYNKRTIGGWGTVRGGRLQPVPKVVCRLLDAWTLNEGPPRPEELVDAGQVALVITHGRHL